MKWKKVLKRLYVLGIMSTIGLPLTVCALTEISFRWVEIGAYKAANGTRWLGNWFGRMYVKVPGMGEFMIGLLKRDNNLP